MAAERVTQEVKEVSEDINVVALVKGEERYIFLYDDDNRARALRTLGRFASKPDLSFSWYDAAVLSQKIRRQGVSENNPTHNRVFVTGTSDLGSADDSGNSK